MSILSNKAIQENLDNRPDSDFETQSVNGGSLIIPITAKHVALAVTFFKNNWKPGISFDFRTLSRLSKCDSSKPAFDFTADGILDGQKLSPKQIKMLFQLWRAEKSERETPEE